MSNVQVMKIHSLTGHRDCVYAIEPADASNLFFSGAGDGMVVLWDLKDPDNGKQIAQLTNSIYALHYLKKKDCVVVGHNYDGIHLLDWKEKKERQSLKLGSAAIFDIQSTGNELLVAGGDGLFTVIDLALWSVSHRLELSLKSARTIAVNVNRGEVAIGFSDCFIRVMDMDNWKVKHEWRAHENSVFAVGYTPDGNSLISGSRDARLKVWDAESGYKQSQEVVAHLYAINDIAYSPDGKHFVTCSLDKSIKVWNSTDLSLLKVIDKSRHAGHGTSVNKLLWTSFDDELVSASDDRTLSVWKLNF